MSVQRILADGAKAYGLERPLSLEDVRWVTVNRIQRRLLRVPGVLEMDPFERRDLIHACADRILV